jgi:hypothetical protein
MSKVPTFDDNLERVMEMGFGRHVLAEIIRGAKGGGVCFDSDPLKMAYKLGLRQFGVDLEERLRQLNGDLWLLMEREMLNLEEDDGKSAPKEDE